MSLQDDVNAEVAAIHSSIDEASAAAGAIGDAVDSIPDSPAVVFDEIINALDTVADVADLIKAAFVAVADAIDGLSGDSSGIRNAEAAIDSQSIRTAAENIENGAVSLFAVKEALTGVASAITPHVAAVDAMATLLIDGSNYAGAEQ